MYPYTNVTANKSFPPSDPLASDGWSSPSFCRPEETTAVHRGGAVLKFKLGYI